MTETTVRQMIFSALIFSAIITGSFIFLSNFIPSGDSADFQEYNGTFSKFNDFKDDADEIQTNAKNAEPTSGLLGIINGLVETIWGTLKLTWNSFTTMDSIIDDLSSVMGLPVWFTGLLISIIGITIAFAIMAAVFKWYI